MNTLTLIQNLFQSYSWKKWGSEEQIKVRSKTEVTDVICYVYQLADHISLPKNLVKTKSLYLSWVMSHMLFWTWLLAMLNIGASMSHGRYFPVTIHVNNYSLLTTRNPDLRALNLHANVYKYGRTRLPNSIFHGTKTQMKCYFLSSTLVFTSTLPILSAILQPCSR